MEPIAIIPLVFFANVLTGIFFIGCWRLKDVVDDKDAPMWALLCCIVPLLFCAAVYAVTVL